MVSHPGHGVPGARRCGQAVHRPWAESPSYDQRLGDDDPQVEDELCFRDEGRIQLARSS
jgi:hypothetical protein